MKLHFIALIIVVCALAATITFYSIRPIISILPAPPTATQAVTSSQKFSEYHALDSFEFNGDVYIELISESSTRLMKLDASKKILKPSNLIASGQQLIQYENDSTGRLSLVVEEKGQLKAILLDDSARIEIKLPGLKHNDFKHSLCCADILRVGSQLYIWHERTFLKIDIYANPPAKVFEKQFQFESADKGNLILQNGKVILNMHDGRKHYYDCQKNIFCDENVESPDWQNELSLANYREYKGTHWNSSWAPSPSRAEVILCDAKDRPVMVTENDGIYLLNDSTWEKKTANLAILNHEYAFQLQGGKICFVSSRLENSKGINQRRIVIYDIEKNTFDVLTLELGKAFDSPQDSLQ